MRLRLITPDGRTHLGKPIPGDDDWQLTWEFEPGVTIGSGESFSVVLDYEVN